MCACESYSLEDVLALFNAASSVARNARVDKELLSAERILTGIRLETISKGKEKKPKSDTKVGSMKGFVRFFREDAFGARTCLAPGGNHQPPTRQRSSNGLHRPYEEKKKNNTKHISKLRSIILCSFSYVAQAERRYALRASQTLPSPESLRRLESLADPSPTDREARDP